MNTKLLLAAAAATLIAVPAMAQVAGAAGVKAGVSTPAAGATAGSAMGVQTNLPAATPPVDTGAVNPPATSATTSATGSASLGAATGTATNTAATAADLTVGAPVTDSTGAPIGTISKVTKGKTNAETMVTLSASGKTATLPAASLSLSGGNLVSTQTKASIWGQK
ncbi:hypothetical protein [Phenylobacterium sp.]|uniref:hypothetical protein n=1 Tax=Phenylobacterium sp. TaxID=1871053 RepID=UPI003BAC558E